jgi:hypothetical protein
MVCKKKPFFNKFLINKNKKRSYIIIKISTIIIITLVKYILLNLYFFRMVFNKVMYLEAHLETH